MTTTTTTTNVCFSFVYRNLSNTRKVWPAAAAAGGRAGSAGERNPTSAFVARGCCLFVMTCRSNWLRQWFLDDGVLRERPRTLGTDVAHLLTDTHGRRPYAETRFGRLRKIRSLREKNDCTDRTAVDYDQRPKHKIVRLLRGRVSGSFLFQPSRPKPFICVFRGLQRRFAVQNDNGPPPVFKFKCPNTLPGNRLSRDCFIPQWCQRLNEAYRLDALWRVCELTFSTFRSRCRYWRVVIFWLRTVMRMVLQLWHA